MFEFNIRIEDKSVKEELEKDMKYLLEEKAELERKIRVGHEARERLSENIEELEKVAIAWIGSKK